MYRLLRFLELICIYSIISIDDYAVNKVLHKHLLVVDDGAISGVCVEETVSNVVLSSSKGVTGDSAIS